MPTYEYECKSCGNTLETFQQITEPPLIECPECKRQSLHRLFGKNVSLVFKGSGFYITDYRSEEYKKREKQEKEREKPKESPSKEEKKPTTQPST